ncbi:hypothetical protein PPL_11799 [Heterostelium album PN500]|uniref:phosphatidylinositol 3-kinase n=1 Tax=Heterostelium pallidum (strain ATCC 26659 / Pp 5 / PN500) TaxID=670386 RepID=D3BUH9_HETP5|nr:hypothetical protein PPL_11799 [Heterostelium album PN500]EFA74767.1 hypothetical protein PPL_11799 [Heterostelium album PN500]|eukprot:XP_020426901.1 hypothetical protein PPL_11799 [Heterostelium album PN500]
MSSLDVIDIDYDQDNSLIALNLLHTIKSHNQSNYNNNNTSNNIVHNNHSGEDEDKSYLTIFLSKRKCKQSKDISGLITILKNQLVETVEELNKFLDTHENDSQQLQAKHYQQWVDIHDKISKDQLSNSIYLTIPNLLNNNHNKTNNNNNNNNNHTKTTNSNSNSKINNPIHVNIKIEQKEQTILHQKQEKEEEEEQEQQQQKVEEQQQKEEKENNHYIKENSNENNKDNNNNVNDIKTTCISPDISNSDNSSSNLKEKEKEKEILESKDSIKYQLQQQQQQQQLQRKDQTKSAIWTSTKPVDKKSSVFFRNNRYSESVNPKLIPTNNNNNSNNNHNNNNIISGSLIVGSLSMNHDKVKTAAINPQRWRFLLTGINQYISPDVPLLSVEYVVERIKRTGEIELTMKEIETANIRKSDIFRRNNYHDKPSQILSVILKPNKCQPAKIRRITNVGSSPTGVNHPSARIADNLMLSDCESDSDTVSAYDVKEHFKTIILAFEFHDYVSPLNIHYPDILTNLKTKDDDAILSITIDDQEKVNYINKQDPLYTLSDEEKALVWRCRYYCQTVPTTLPKLLQSLQWTNPEHLSEMFRFLKNWPIIEPIESLELLDPKFADCVEIREFNTHLAETFSKEIQSLKVLENLSRLIKDIPFEKRRTFIEEHLRDIKGANNFRIPFDPSIYVTDIIPEKCKAMDSAKAPLWIVYKNRDLNANHFQMIVKTGDDLRQDILTLQLLKLMDHMWKSEGLDLHMTIYRCLATGLGTGLIEVVNNSETAARIQSAAGGMTGVFKQTPIANWLKNQNITENTYRAAVTKFTLSCAGYCVATYVLGIGDRHNDNIMIDKFGHLFHIDFGHFLGNFKTFAGFQREKAPFVLTPDFVFVIGKDSPNFDFFVETCCKAYNILRKNSHIFFNMFELMLSTGIPELRSESDILYLRDKFRTDLTDEEASERFIKLIHESINTLTTQINFAIHIMAHRKAIAIDKKTGDSSRE